MNLCDFVWSLFDVPVENLWKTVENFLPVENSWLGRFLRYVDDGVCERSAKVDEYCYTETMDMKKNPVQNARIASLDIHSPGCLRSARDESLCGDIGDMYFLVDAATKAGISLIEFVPIQDTSGPCPYMCQSIFSFNPIFLDARNLGQLPRLGDPRPGKIDQRNCLKQKISVLKSHYERVGFGSEKIEDYNRHVVAYALFKVLKKRFKRTWVHWPGIFSSGDVQKILTKHPRLHDLVKLELFVQKTMADQWSLLADYAQKRGVYFVMDKPAFPVHDSAEVWANQGLFHLNADGTLAYESGCNNPRDPFGPQRWGHAVYRFKEKPDEVINYFLEVIRHLSSISPVIRIDHALALVWKYYLIETKSGRGRLFEALRERLFSAMKSEFPDILFIADDLGYSSKKIDALYKKFDIATIRCPQWSHAARYNEIHRYPQRSMATTSTHDTESLAAWWKQLSHEHRRIYFKKMQGIARRKMRRKKIRIPFDLMIKQMVLLMFRSRAQIASVSVADLMGDMRRYNKPGEKNRTNWKVRHRVPTSEIDFGYLRTIIEQTGRLPNQK